MDSSTGLHERSAEPFLGSTKPVSVLIADDDSAICEVITKMFEGYTVHSVHSGEDALAALPQVKPDLVLLDVGMPRMSGLEVCRRIRQDPQFRFTKVVLISGQITLEDRLAGYAAGADDYLTKPVSMHELLAKVGVLAKLKTVEELDEIKRSFLNLISHETRTPITVIKGLCELALARNEPDANELMDAMRIISRSTDRLWSLAEKTLLSCTLRSSPQIPLAPTPVGDILDCALEEVSQYAAECGVSVQEEIEAALLPGNVHYLSRAIKYVVENAVKHSPRGGSVLLRGRRSATAYQLEVADRGKGIPAERLAQIFELFSIKDVEHHTAGLGLSLALAREIVALHGGTLTAANNSYGGASFTFMLPLLERSATEPAGPSRG